MLTDTFIKSLRPAPLPKKYFDGNGTGLHLICNPGGKKTFAIKYLHPVTRKEQTLNVGEYPSTTLKDARDQAINTRVLLAQGIDPRELRAQERMKEKATIVNTFKNLGRNWMQVRDAGWSDSYGDKTETMLDRHLFSSLGAFPITQITAPQLLAVLRPIEETGKTDLAHTLMQHASAIFRFAMAIARAIADPAAALRAALAPHKQENFPAITDPDEFAKLLLAMDCYQGEYITRAALGFTLLTFQRSQSIRFARWDQIDWNANLLATMRELGLEPSYSRPRVSNDNAYAEALFRTAKYCPMWPEQPFDTLDEARDWVVRFVNWYNDEHRHSALKYVTPSQRHRGLDGDVLANRALLYAKARSLNPQRWASNLRNWQLEEAVYLNPEREQNKLLTQAA